MRIYFVDVHFHSIFSEITIRTLAKMYYYMQLVWQISCSIRYIFDSERSNITQIWQFLIDYLYTIIIDIQLWFFCSIAPHKCSELPFMMCSILKQCWSVGYLSLLTLSFIEHVYLHCMQYLDNTTLVIFTLKITACNDITYIHGIKPGVSK